MIMLDREIKSTIIGKSIYHGFSQAAFNSDGRLTLRNYCDDGHDEIITFTEAETRAIVALFEKISVSGNGLPY